MLTEEDLEGYERGSLGKHDDEMRSVIDFAEENSVDHQKIIELLEAMDGKSSFDNHEQTIHRSETSDKMFREVKANVERDGRDTIMVLDFLKFLYKNEFISGSENIVKQKEPESLIYNPDEKQDELHTILSSLNLKRKKLLKMVFGQDEVIKEFTEGLFHSEMQSSFFPDQNTPRAVFVFAGPPGVGKTFLAETYARLTGREFRRFDMSGYAEHHHHEELVGLAEGYKGAKPGLLTKLVYEHPTAVLIFDEVEKAHQNTIHLFLQILESGWLDDKYDKNIKANFRDTVIIFTTNAGRSLYENEKFSNLTGFHSKTIINALETEIDPKSGQPFFPAAICSRLSSGYVLLFNHLKITDLVSIVKFQLDGMGKGFKDQYGIQVEFDNLLPYLLILREGAKRDARTIRSQAAKFFSQEVFKITSYFKEDKLRDALSAYSSINFSVDGNVKELLFTGDNLFSIPLFPSVLFFTTSAIFSSVKNEAKDIRWISSQSSEGLLNVLGDREVDIILIDMGIESTDEGSTDSYFAGYTPVTGRKYDLGRNILRMINTRYPDIPVYLFKLSGDQDGKGNVSDEEFINYSIREGGASGIFRGRYSYIEGKSNALDVDTLINDIHIEWEKVRLEKVVRKLSQEHKVLSFDTVPISRYEQKGTIQIKIRNPRISRALRATDVGEVLDDVSRPDLTFDHVIGAEMAKNELRFFKEYIINPARFINVKPSRGILLYGPPGTGKTLLAKAFAGETNLAFLHANAANFITPYQGSGPDNVRRLFQRARDNAPAIIFIDEIDAIGKARTGSSGQQEMENTLNTLLVEMDGFEKISHNETLFVIAATNADLYSTAGSAVKILDPALVRRFSKTIFIDLPDRKSREEYVNYMLGEWIGKEITDGYIKNFIYLSSGLSFSDINSIIENALRVSSMNDEKINDEYLDNAFHEKYGDIISLDKSIKQKLAFHEAGHAIMLWLTDRKVPAYVTIIARSRYGGYTAPLPEDNDQGILSKKQLLNRIKVALAGKASEQILFADDEITTSAADDLEYASGLVINMISKYGMYEDFGLLSEAVLHEYKSGRENDYNSRMIILADKIVKEQYVATLATLKNNRLLLDKVADELLHKGKLTNNDLSKIFEKQD